MKMIILIATTLFSGLIAGLFYAWSVSVTPGLAKITDASYLQAFQSMNRAIMNPFFLVAFFGLIFLLPLLCYLNYQPPVSMRFWLIIASTVLYLVGVAGVTIIGNVPLNAALEGLKIESMTSEQMSSFRLGFEHKWNKLNMVRTICSSLSFLLLIMACMRNFGE